MREGWTQNRLGNLCMIQSGNSNTKDAVSNGSFIFFDRSKTPKRSSRFLFDCEAIIIAGEGAEFLPKKYSGKFDLHQRAYAIFGFGNLLSGNYLYYYLTYIHKYFQEVAVGATVKSLRQRHFDELPVLLPQSIEEQKRIVAILDESFEGIDKTISNTKKNLANIREMFENCLYLIFTQKGNGWVITTLGELCERVEYGTSSKSKPVGIVPVLRMGNIQNGKFCWEKLVYTDNDEEIEKYLLKKNDVLFNRTNSAELVGKTAIYKGERPAIFAGYLIRVHRKEELIDAEFLNYYLNSIPARAYGETVMSRSINQANINGTKLKQYPISIPSLKKQQKIISKIRVLEAETQRLEVVYQQKLTSLAELKQSLLQKAFSGELTKEATPTKKEADA